MQILKGHASGKPIYCLDFAPSGTHFASSAQDETVRLWDLATGQSQVVGQGDSWFVQFSPSGDRLLFSDPQGVTVLNRKDDTRLRLNPCALGTAVFSHDARTVVAAEGNLLQFHDADTGQLRATATVAASRLVLKAVSADGRLIAAAGWVDAVGEQRAGYPILVLEYPTGREVCRFDEPTDYIKSIAFSHDGRLLAATSATHLRVWELESKRIVFHDQPDRRHFHGVAFSPDGHWLAAAHHDACVRLYSTNGWGVRETLDWGIGPIVAVCFAADGMRAASGSKKGKIVIWDIAP